LIQCRFEPCIWYYKLMRMSMVWMMT